jgi:hypothetical protein
MMSTDENYNCLIEFKILSKSVIKVWNYYSLYAVKADITIDVSDGNLPYNELQFIR